MHVIDTPVVLKLTHARLMERDGRLSVRIAGVELNVVGHGLSNPSHLFPFFLLSVGCPNRQQGSSLRWGIAVAAVARQLERAASTTMLPTKAL
jgi:hypothetical protein